MCKEGLWSLPKVEQHVEISAERLRSIIDKLAKDLQSFVKALGHYNPGCRGRLDKMTVKDTGLLHVPVLGSLIREKFRAQFETQAAAKSGC